MNKNTAGKLPVKYIIIACCTYKRPEKLERLLKNLCTINYPENIKTEILVIDNDKAKSAEGIVEKFQDVLAVHYIMEEEKGLSNVRNRAIKEAFKLGAGHIAFIDDDEIADINWLVNHVDFYKKFENIYISSGPACKKFENKYPDYIINNIIFSASSSKKLGEYKKTCASNNVFFPLNIIEESRIYFSVDFNLSGSEDTDFFGRLKEAGYAIGWNYNSVVFELVNDERADIKWILKRAFYNGYSVSVVKFLHKKQFFNRLMYISSKFLTICLDLLIVVFSLPFGLTKFFNSLTRLTKNSGKFAGAVILRNHKYYGEQ